MEAVGWGLLMGGMIGYFVILRGDAPIGVALAVIGLVLIHAERSRR